MDKAIRSCIAAKVKIYYSDTDSLIVGIPRGVLNPLVMGFGLHSFKDELETGDILSFHSLGPKLYQLRYKDKNTKEIITETKQKGFFLKSKFAKEIVHDTLYKQFIDALLHDTFKSAIIGQFQIRTSKEYRLYSCITQKILKNDSFSKRVICSSKKEKVSFRTLPYGFTAEMFINEILSETCCLCQSLDLFTHMPNCFCNCHI